MTDPEERDVPTLEDELLGPAGQAGTADSADPAYPAQRVRTEPRIRLPWAPPWTGAGAPGCRDIGCAAAGFMTFVFIDGVMMYAPLMARHTPTLLPQLVTLLVLAFGLGSLLVWHVRGVWRPYGFGMMLGWVFLTLISAGFLTGVTL